MTNVSEYGMPNIGCLIGAAYQQQLSGLSAALAAKGLDITPMEYLVLRCLYTHDGMQQCDISTLIGKDKAGVSRCISAMERKGLVRVEAVSHKCRRIWLADHGTAIEPMIMQVAADRHQTLTDIINPDDMETFVSVLKLILTQK